MANLILNKNYTAQAAINPCRIVKFGSTDGSVLQGAAASDLLIGVAECITVAIGERVDVFKAGIADVEFGGTVARGNPVTSDSTGRAVIANPAAGANARIIGFAEVSAVVGDIAPVLIAPGVMQG